jgi:hypothetical protein
MFLLIAQFRAVSLPMIARTKELINPAVWKKLAIWNDLVTRSGVTMPDLSELQVIHQKRDMTALSECSP